MVEIRPLRIALFSWTTSRNLVDGQIALILSENVVFLFWFHVGSLVVWLVKNKLVGTCSTGESISTLVVIRGLRNGKAITAVWADWSRSAGGLNGTDFVVLQVGGIFHSRSRKLKFKERTTRDSYEVDEYTI